MVWNLASNLVFQNVALLICLEIARIVKIDDWCFDMGVVICLCGWWSVSDIWARCWALRTKLRECLLGGWTCWVWSGNIRIWKWYLDIFNLAFFTWVIDCCWSSAWPLSAVYKIPSSPSSTCITRNIFFDCSSAVTSRSDCTQPPKLAVWPFLSISWVELYFKVQWRRFVVGWFSYRGWVCGWGFGCWWSVWSVLIVSRAVSSFFVVIGRLLFCCRLIFIDS